MSLKRRDFITLLGSAAAWPLAGLGQQRERPRRIGVLIGGDSRDPAAQSYLAAFRDALAKLGWIEGRNLQIDLRFAEGDVDRIRASASEVVSLAPEVIFVTTGVATRMLKQETQSIPIVFAGASVGGDIVQNIARPEGNITGFQILYPSIGGKWLELLKEAAPYLTRVAVIAGATGATAGANYLPAIEAAARALRLKTVATALFRDSTELERAVESFAAEPNGGLIVLPSTGTSTRDNRQLILLLAAKHGLPVIHFDKPFPAEGGLMSYGSDFTDLNRRAVGYVNRILHGGNVNELPVQFPTKFELVVNRKAARVIGLAIPETFLVRADELIE
jgi:putative ABC transport system substrate-binding protein